MNATQTQPTTRTKCRLRAHCVASIAGRRVWAVSAQGLLTVALGVALSKAQAQNSPAAPAAANAVQAQTAPPSAPASAVQAVLSTAGKNAPIGTLPLLDEKGQRLDIPQNVLGFGGASMAANTAPGVGALESLSGNGTRSGYTLAHNAVLPASISIYVGGRRLVSGQDYWLDGDGGTLFFAAPVRASDTISVSYRWLPDAPAPRAGPGLGLSLTEKTRLNLLYGQTTRPANGLSLALNGLRLDSAFGQKDSSRYTGLAYFADTQRTPNATLSWRDVMNDPVKGKPAPLPSTSLLGSGHLLSQSLQLQQGGLRLSGDFQDVSRQFAGFAGLKQGAVGDKAALEQLARLEKEQGLTRLGFGVGLGGKAGDKTPRGLSFAWSQIQDSGDKTNKTGKPDAGSPTGVKPANAITRQSLGFDTAQFHFALSSQSVAGGFMRLNDLADAEKSGMGKETGLRREQMSLLWQPDKTSKIGFSRLHVAATTDAIAAAMTQATKDTKDDKDKTDQAKKLADARQKAQAGAERETFQVEFKGLKFAANQTHSDKDFARANDLGLADADKQALGRDRGYTSKDTSFRFDGLKGLLLDNYTYSGESAADKLRHDIARRTITVAPSKSLSFTVGTDHDLTTKTADAAALAAGANIPTTGTNAAVGDATRTGTTHSVVSLKDLLTKTAAFSAQRDETRLLDKGKETQITIADALSLGMSRDKRGAGLEYQDKRIAFANGKYDNTIEFNIHAKPTDALTVQVARRDIDRKVDDADTKTEDKKDGILSTESVELDFKATKNFSILFGQSQTDVLDKPQTVQADKTTLADTAATVNATGADKTDTDKKSAVKPTLGLTDSSTVSVGIKSEPGKNITIAARFDETHDEGKNTREQADISIGNAKPLTLGPLRELTVKAGYASLNDKRLLQNETMTGHAAWKLWKHEFLLDYGGFSKLDGKTLTETTSRTYSFKTDPGAQRWFHGNFLYKVRTLADGKDYLVRKFGADALLFKKTRLSYAYGILPENEQGVMQPTETGELALSHALSPQSKVSLFYRMNNHQPELLGKPDPAASAWTRAVGVGYESALGAKSKWGLALSRESNGYGLFSDRSDRLRVSYERQLGADNFVSLATEYRTHDGRDADGKDLHGEVRATLDLSRHF